MVGSYERSTSDGPCAENRSAKLIADRAFSPHLFCVPAFMTKRLAGTHLSSVKYHPSSFVETAAVVHPAVDLVAGFRNKHSGNLFSPGSLCGASPTVWPCSENQRDSSLSSDSNSALSRSA